MDVTLIVSGSTFLQFAAASMALRLVWVSEKRLGWALVATAILFMAGRRGINLVAYLGGEQTSPADIAAEWVALCISLLMVIGLRLIAPTAFSARRTRKTLLTRFGHILDESFNEIYIFDARTLKFLQTNRGARLNLGYSTEELLKLTPLDLKPDYSQSSFENLLQPLLSGEKDSLFFETRHKRKDGTLYPIEVRLQTSEMDGSPVFVTIILDITERKEAEQALRKSQKLTEELLENIPAFIFIKDLDGRYLMANKYFEDELALTQDQILGKTDFEIFPEEIAQSFVENDQEVLVSKSKKVFEEIIPFADGPHTSITTKFPIKNKLGEISGICGIVIDITDRKKAEQALIASEQMLQTVLDTIPTRVFWKDRDLKYLGCNTPFAKDAGMESPQEIIGKDDLVMCWREQAEIYRADDRQVIQSGIPKIHYEETQTLADGSLAWVRTSKIPLQDMEGNITGVLGTYEDITEKKLADEEMKKSRSQLRDLCAHLETVREEENIRMAREIHDELGQTLTAMKLDLNWMKSRVAETPSIVEKIQSLTRLIDDTGNVIQRICSEMRPQILDILGLPEAMNWQAREFEKRTGIECDLDLQPGLDELDPKRSTTFFRIFQEALTNVMRHAEGTQVSVQLKSIDDDVILRIEDNGKGFDDKAAPRPNSFGLIGIRERVLAWGGEVELRSQPGKGTTLSISIPLEKHAIKQEN